ncbi:MAG: carbohydrate ABC transporter permease [Firmicutes bacterium]|nr:carbohydrate ABC transporter permease [Bacillota bacterium]
MKYQIRQSKADTVFGVINAALLGFVILIVLYPLVFILSASFSDPVAVMSGRVWLWPISPTLKGYSAVFSNNSIVASYINSIIYTVAGTLVNVCVTIMAAYPLSRKELYGRNVFMFLFSFTMLFSGGMIPSYLLVRGLKLIDTRWALIIPVALGVWDLIITRTYLQSNIPQELYEAAEIDGAGDFRVLVQIVLPLSTPILAVITLFYAIRHWNSYFDALLYLKSMRLFPLQLTLRNILILNTVDLSMLTDVEEIAQRQGIAELLKYSLIVVASAPVLLIYPFVQKYFIKGIMIGSLKG